MLKQWSLKSVFDSHNYGVVIKSDVHECFSQWLKKEFGISKVKIIDIGGGNGRVCLNIEENIKDYLCLDLNPENIKTGIDFFRDKKNIRFELFDTDSTEISQNCDVVYIDSVLTMLENPFLTLRKMKKICKYIFINRVEFKSNLEKSNYKWGGMNEPSIFWSFSRTSFEDFCDENNFELSLINDISFVLKNNDYNND